LRFWRRKLIGSLLAALGATLLVSIFLHLVPGDPVEVMLGEQAQSVDREELRRQMWLDRPVPEQVWLFLRGYATGDLRSSLPPFDQRVLPRLGRAAPRTALLAALALALALALSLPLGLLSAVFAGRAIDRAAMGLAVLGISAPSFLIGQVLILIFGIRLRWFPVSADGGPLSIVLPAVTLGLALSAMLSRMTRAAMLDVIHEDYVLAARARGLPERTVILKHALRNALLPILTVLGLQFGGLLTGAIVIEKVFNWPGLGTLLVTSIERRDYNAVRACVLTFTLTYIAINLLTDLAYAAADPRARRTREVA
jgi:ABC-type dipeptide/oligopeptide/nickel transport system permease component